MFSKLYTDRRSAHFSAPEDDFVLGSLAAAQTADALARALGDAIDARLAPRGIAIHLRFGAAVRTAFARGLRSSGSAHATVCSIERAGERVGLIELLAPRALAPQDHAWLRMAARIAASELERIAAERRADALEHQRKKLDRCVPAAVRDALRDSRSITGHVDSLTVAFVDLRNYTAWAAQRSGSEVFALLDRYSLAASDVIQRHGGWLVDLEGDGLMAAFGAPQPLPDKERAALAAARDIAALAPSLHGGEISDRPALGVGIATGPGFAGFLRAVDYSVWSVVGETTNRAARLQQLARDRGVEIVLDEATVRACGEAGAQLTSLGPISLRGLSEPCEVWATRAR